MNMMKTTARANEFSTLTIYHLKVHVNAECNTLMKAVKIIVMENYEEGHQNRFCQFAHDKSTLKKG